MTKLLDKKQGGVYPFTYVNSDNTDIRRLFKRIRKERLEALTPEKTRERLVAIPGTTRKGTV